MLLSAGLDTFAQRRPDLASRLVVFEVDQPGTQAWKRQRLIDLGYGVPEWLRLVPVDFEEGASWQDDVAQSGFDPARPAVVASTGVSMYLTREANQATLRDLATLAPGSTVACVPAPARPRRRAGPPGLDDVRERRQGLGNPVHQLLPPG